MKLLALVTLYYPPAHITDNLLTYAEDVDGLFVWDNTPGGSNYQFPESISHKIVRLRQGENTGIGKALNAAAMFALDNGYTYLLTMDQDSAFTASTFKDYIRIINNDKDSSHFAYIPLINASGTDSNAPLKEAQGMIISGSIFPLRTIQKVGLYLDKFVMDAIDTEYFLRIRRHTGKVMLVPAANLKHELGHPLRKQILIWHPMSLNYSPVRTYYIARNFLYLNKQYAEFKRPELLWKLIWERPFYILFMEENKWEKLKATCKNITGETLAFLTYKKPVLLNCHLKFDPNQHFHIPELGIDGDYLHAFRKMTEITWKLNEVTGRECRHLADNLQLPQEYVGCQIRGGDKITETNLLPAEYYIRLIKQKTDLRDVFVLTDDYRIFRQVQSLAPDIRWYTLCDSGEKGYVNSAFTQTTKELKQKQMTRFLSSIQVLMNASVFTGSITTGPSLFLLKKFYPDISPADCLLEDFPQAATLPIPGRSQMAAEFLQGNLKL